MFKISPIQDVALQKKCAENCGTEYKAGAFAYVMNDAESGSLMGFSQFEINENGGYLYDLRPTVGCNDFEAMFILGRSTMNFIDLCGKHTITASPDSADERLLRGIGLKLCENGEYFCDMTGFFDGSHCSGHKTN